MNHCIDCKFFHFNQCRRNPPVSIVYTKKNIESYPPSESIDSHPGWPGVGQHDWCGEFKGKIND